MDSIDGNFRGQSPSHKPRYGFPNHIPAIIFLFVGFAVPLSHGELLGRFSAIDPGLVLLPEHEHRAGRRRGGAQHEAQGTDEDDSRQRGNLHQPRHALEQARALRTIVTLPRRFEHGGSRAGDPRSAGAPSSHTRPPSVSTHPSPGGGSDASRPSSPTVGHAARPDPPKCPAHRPSSSRNQASRTLGSRPRGSVGARRAASSAYRRSYSAANCRRSFAEANAVQNVAAAPIFPSLRGDREEEEQGLEGQDTGKKEEEEEKDSPHIPPSV